MLWSSFISSIDDCLTVDAGRKASFAYKDRMIRAAIWDLQNMIPAYRTPGRTVLQAHDFAVFPLTDPSEGEGTEQPITQHMVSVYRRPRGRAITSIWMRFPQRDTINDYLGALTRYRLEFVPWRYRFDLARGCSQGCGDRRQFRYSMSPNGDELWVFPRVFAPNLVEIFWDSNHMTFTENDEIPFFEEAVKPVAEYVKAHIHREVNDDLRMYDSYMRSYNTARRDLYLRLKEETSVKELEDPAVPPCSFEVLPEELVATNRVATPVFDPTAADSMYAQAPLYVQITCATPGAIIRYTTDGSDPTPESPLYEGIFIITRNMTIRAKAFVENMTPSWTNTETYYVLSDPGEDFSYLTLDSGVVQLEGGLFVIIPVTST